MVSVVLLGVSIVALLRPVREVVVSVLPVVPLMPLLDPDPVVPLVLLPVVPEEPVIPVEPVVPVVPVVEPGVPACPVVVSREGIELVLGVPMEPLLVVPGVVMEPLVVPGEPAFGVAPPCVPCGLEALGLPPPPACANARPEARARAADVARISCFFMGELLREGVGLPNSIGLLQGVCPPALRSSRLAL